MSRRISKFLDGPGSRVAPTYTTWQRMKTRCLNPASADYARYGGRGIGVCARWLVYDNFLADMGPRPAGLQLDRINNEGHYEPGNCRWVSKQQNARNRSSNVQITRDGITKIVVEWCEELSLDPEIVYRRLRDGWRPEHALLPKGSKNPNRPAITIAKSEGHLEPDVEPEISEGD